MLKGRSAPAYQPRLEISARCKSAIAYEGPTLGKLGRQKGEAPSHRVVLDVLAGASSPRGKPHVGSVPIFLCIQDVHGYGSAGRFGRAAQKPWAGEARLRMFEPGALDNPGDCPSGEFATAPVHDFCAGNPGKAGIAARQARTTHTRERLAQERNHPINGPAQEGSKTSKPLIYG